MDSGRIFHKSQWDRPSVWGRVGLKGIRMTSILGLSIYTERGAGRGPRGYRTATKVPRRRRGCGGWGWASCSGACDGPVPWARQVLFSAWAQIRAQLYLWGWMGLALGLCQLQTLLGLLGQKFRDSRRPPFRDLDGSWCADQEAEAQRG